jgi:hypothetical protein
LQGRSFATAIFETGIKVIDLLAAPAGKNGAVTASVRLSSSWSSSTRCSDSMSMGDIADIRRLTCLPNVVDACPADRVELS